MMNIKQISLTLLCSISFFSLAEEAENTAASGYISESLFVYMHSGAGKNYRILGTINSGDKVQLTGESDNNYSQVITDKDKTGWVESEHVSTKPGMRYVIADLNEKLAGFQNQSNNTNSQLENARSQIDSLKAERSELQNNISALTMTLAQTKSQLKSQDTDIKKQWFFNGAIVLGIGLLFGLVLPRLFSKRKSKMENWG
jgi:SH3 domain protein